MVHVRDQALSHACTYRQLTQWKPLEADEVPEAASQARVHLMRLKVRACMRRCHHPLPGARADATPALQAMAEHPDHARVESREFTQQIVEQYQALILGLATFDAASASTGAVAVLATRARSTRTRPGGSAPQGPPKK